MSNDVKYAEELIQHIESDKRATMLFVLFDLGLLGVSINILFRPEKLILPCPIKSLFTISVLLICLSTYLLFLWYRRLHIERLRVTSFFKNQDPNEIQNIFDRHHTHGLWRTEGWYFNWGWYCLIAGVAGHIVVALFLLWGAC